MKKYDVNIFTDGACSGNPVRWIWCNYGDGWNRPNKRRGLDTQLTTEWNCLSYYWIREP
jgi:hypothetical protein